jgi:hypothetical protein
MNYTYFLYKNPALTASEAKPEVNDIGTVLSCSKLKTKPKLAAICIKNAVQEWLSSLIIFIYVIRGASEA